MKITKEYLKKVISEILKLGKGGETEEFGPPKEIDAVYHDSSREDNVGGYTPMKKPLKIRILKKKDGSDETQFEEIN